LGLEVRLHQTVVILCFLQSPRQAVVAVERYLGPVVRVVQEEALVISQPLMVLVTLEVTLL
jgi:hypothetical protein